MIIVAKLFIDYYEYIKDIYGLKARLFKLNKYI